MVEFQHTPVLMEEVLSLLALKPGMTVIDCTTGGGSHSYAMLKEILPGGQLIGLDQDTTALEAARRRLAELGEENFRLIHSNFLNLDRVRENLGGLQADAILMDLGVSSYQLDEGSRGFSYQQSGLLDMRMDQTAAIPTAADIVNQWPEAELARIIWEYGEERWGKRIAQFIAEARRQTPIRTTDELVSIIKKAIPAGARQEGPHPAKRTFQALRIAVNGELEILERAVTSAVKALKPGGRIGIITFHSLEDRIVKNTFRALAQGCICPKNIPICQCHQTSQGKVLTSKPILPSERELEQNPRSRSAKLRGFLKK
jgi:16S rRNA (cytosine1402-N4)-methyltransferase